MRSDSKRSDGTLRVLVVDDSSVIRERLAAMLTEIEGVDLVGMGCDGREGLELVARFEPDVVVLDIRMPHHSGIELLRKIKQLLDPAPKVMILTNYPYPAYRTRCMDLGADYFFDKSTEFDSVTEVLRGLVSGESAV